MTTNTGSGGAHARLVGDQLCGFSNWELDLGCMAASFGGFMDGLVNNALAAEDGVTVTFPFIYSTDGAAMSPTAFGIENDRAGPLTLRVCLPFGDNQDDDVHLDADLRAALVDDIGQCRKDGSYREGLAAIADAMRKLADDIDRAVADGKRAEAEAARIEAQGPRSPMNEADALELLEVLRAAPRANRVFLLQGFLRERGPLTDAMREPVAAALATP